MGRMQVHHRARGAAGLVQCGMQRHFLGRGIAGEEAAIRVKPRQPRRIERAEGGIGRRHQPAAVIKSDADIARGTRRQATLEQRAAEAADFLTDFGFAHGSIPAAYLFPALSHALAARPSRDTPEAKPLLNSAVRKPEVTPYA